MVGYVQFAEIIDSVHAKNDDDLLYEVNLVHSTDEDASGS